MYFNTMISWAALHDWDPSDVIRFVFAGIWWIVTWSYGMMPSTLFICLWVIVAAILLCLMLVTRARVPWFQIWTYYCIMRIIIVLDHIYELYRHIIVRNRRPQSDNNWDSRREWLWCEDHVCSRSVNALLRCSIKRSTLSTSSFPWGPAANGLVGQKMTCKFLIASTHN